MGCSMQVLKGGVYYYNGCGVNVCVGPLLQVVSPEGVPCNQQADAGEALRPVRLLLLWQLLQGR